MSSQVDDRPATNGHQPDPQLHTFRGRTLDELLPQIRAELGPDAVVVRQREGLLGGIGGFFQQTFVEVQARRGASRVDMYDAAPAMPGTAGAMAGGDAAVIAGPVSAARQGVDVALSLAARTGAAGAGAPDAAVAMGAAGALAVAEPPRPAAPAPAQAQARTAAPAPAQATAPAGRARPAAKQAASRSQPKRKKALAPLAPPPTKAQLRAAAAAAEGELPRPGTASGPRMSAAELLRQATGGALDDTRTPQEILREHTNQFAQQLAEAEQLEATVVPTVSRPARRAAARTRAAAARVAERADGTYVTPLAARPQDDPEALVPALAPDAAAVELAEPPAAETAATADRVAAAPGTSPAKARRAAKRSGAKRRASRARAAANAIAASAVPAEPIRGVGPQTAKALELAAAIAANVAQAHGARAGRAGTPPIAGAMAAASAARRTNGHSAPAQRRTLWARRRATTTPRRLVTAPAAAEVTTALSRRGLATTTSDELLRDAGAHVLPFTPGADVRVAVRGALASRIPVAAPPRSGGRVVAFVGAGGSGKTRCTAGFAAAYASGSTLPVACLTLAPADGGAELSALLKPHGVKVEAVDTPEEAVKRLRELRVGAVVVLDTPAVATGDPEAVDAFGEQLRAMEVDEVQLVVPATLSGAVAQELVERTASLEPSAMTMTHADATEHIGAVVELSCATRLPLAYVNSGTELPGSLAQADPLELAARLLG